MHEFQVVYRLRVSEAVPGTQMSIGQAAGPLQTVSVFARDENEAEQRVSSADIVVLSVSAVRPVIDWNAATFDLQSAAVFCQGTIRKIQHAQAKGELPKAKGAQMIFRREDLLEWIKRHQERAA